MHSVIYSPHIHIHTHTDLYREPSGLCLWIGSLIIAPALILSRQIQWLSALAAIFNSLPGVSDFRAHRELLGAGRALLGKAHGPEHRSYSDSERLLFTPP